MADSPPPDPGEVTVLLRRSGAGGPDAFDEVFPLVYRELRRIARQQLGRERTDHTLQPTALVNEAYLKLVRRPPQGSRDRSHFVAVAARAMRQVLVDHARARRTAKRGGGVAPQPLAEDPGDVTVDLDQVLALDAALDRLDRLDSRLRQVVELRYFGGLTDGEIGELLGVTRRTVLRDWTKARAWLHRELSVETEDAP